MHRLSWTAAIIGQLCVIFTALTIWLPSSLFAQTKPQGPGYEAPVVRVPFVGCSSDGQVGPVAAPKGAEKLVGIDAGAAQKLAYYKAENSPGVLAPRGWYCFGTYGSGSSSLLVTPQPIKTDKLLSATSGGITGPAISVSETNGGTSGRFAVAGLIARVFPARKTFVQSVIKEGLVPASEFPFGPYPNDKLIFQSDRIVEYQTPPHSEGLGAMGWFKTSDYPTNGVAILQGEVPDLLFLAVRLPPDLNDLASHIIRQAERDNAALMTSQGMAAEPLRIENRHVDRKLPGCGNERDGCYHLEFSYVEVIGGPAAARARINAAILAFLTDRDEGRGMLTPESFAQDYIDSSASVQKEHPDFPSSSLTRAVTVLRSAAPVFSLAFY
jgi:hypothetical protein